MRPRGADHAHILQAMAAFFGKREVVADSVVVEQLQLPTKQPLRVYAVIITTGPNITVFPTYEPGGTIASIRARRVQSPRSHTNRFTLYIMLWNLTKLSRGLALAILVARLSASHCFFHLHHRQVFLPRGQSRTIL